MNPQIEYICKESKITDYLRSKGIEPVSRGKNLKYHCMLPNHSKDNTPSFYVTKTPDGVELFKCFGCGAGGGIVSIIREMEHHKSNGSVIRKLARTLNINLEYIADTTSIEPSSDFIVSQFCEEDELTIYIADTIKEFIKANWNNEDAINKISMIYKQVDEMIEEGRENELIQLFSKLTNAIETYES